MLLLLCDGLLLVLVVERVDLEDTVEQLVRLDLTHLLPELTLDHKLNQRLIHPIVLNLLPRLVHVTNQRQVTLLNAPPHRYDLLHDQLAAFEHVEFDLLVLLGEF